MFKAILTLGKQTWFVDLLILDSFWDLYEKKLNFEENKTWKRFCYK